MYRIFLSCLLILGCEHAAYSQTSVSGSQIGTWSIAGSPYNVIGNVTVPSGQTLTIQAGVTVNFQSTYTLAVSTNGTLQANGVIFNRTVANSTPYVSFAAGTGNLTNCTLNGLYVYATGPAPRTITGNTISGVTYPIRLYDGATPAISGNDISGCTNQGIELTGMSSNRWSLPNYGLPYYVTAALSPSGKSLTIASGVTLNVTGSYLIGANATNDTLQANGVIFNRTVANSTPYVSFAAGTGNLTNCTLNGLYVYATGPAPRTITGNTISGVTYPIRLYDGATPAISGNDISGCTNQGIELTGMSSNRWSLPNYGLPYYVTAALSPSGKSLTIASGVTLNVTGSYLIGANATNDTLQANGVIFNRTVANSTPYVSFAAGTGNLTNCTLNGLYVYATGPAPRTITGNTISGVTYPIRLYDGATPAISGNDISGCTNQGIELTGMSSNRWSLPNYGLPYYVTAALSPSGKSLTIASGVTLNVTGSYLIGANATNDTLQANGVIFNRTVANSTPYVSFAAGTGNLTNCTLNGLYVYATGPAPRTITGNTISGVTYPIRLQNGAAPTISENIIAGATYAGIEISGTATSTWKLPHYGLPVYLSASVYLSGNGLTFSIAPTDTLFFQGEYQIYNSSGSSNDTISFMDVRLIKNWKGSGTGTIRIRGASSAAFVNCDLRGVEIAVHETSSLLVQGSSLCCSDVALSANGNSIVAVHNCDFFHNVTALSNLSSYIVHAQTNYWGHPSGPRHVSNPSGLGETVEGNVDFSSATPNPYGGSVLAYLETSNIHFGSVVVGSSGDLPMRLSAIGDVDLLVTNVTSDNPAFKPQPPLRFWVAAGETSSATLRFTPFSGTSMTGWFQFHTNAYPDSVFTVLADGRGASPIALSVSSLDFGSVLVGKYQTLSFRIFNRGFSNVTMDSILVIGDNYSMYVGSQSAMVQETEGGTAGFSRTRLETSAVPGFSLPVGDSERVTITYHPTSRHIDNATLQIYYSKTGVEVLPLFGRGYADALTADIVSISSQGFPFVYLNVAVDTFAVGIGSLGASDISVKEDGKIESDMFTVTPPGSSGGSRLADIVFLMDNSGSMASEQASIEANMIAFVNQLANSGVDYALGLCRYGASENSGNPIIEDAGILTRDPQYFKNVVWKRNVSNGGTEPGYYSLLESTSGFAFRKGGQKIFIIVTDETPNQGGTTLAQAQSACVSNSVSVFALTLSSLFGTFKPIADATGGQVFDVLAKFNPIFEYISSHVVSTYVVQYRSSDTSSVGQLKTVEVEVKHNGAVAHDTATYIPRSEPVITRNSFTLSLHTRSSVQGSPLGIEADIIDRVAPGVKSTTLHYKNTKDSLFAQIPMTLVSGTLYRGTIAGSAVTPPGIDYFISATDGITTASDPSSQASLNPYQLAVLPNVAARIHHSPVLRSPLAQEILIEADIIDNTNYLVVAALFFRKKGQLAYTRQEMVKGSSTLYEAKVPQSVVTAGGVEYYIKATDDFGLSSTNGTADHPNQIRVTTHHIPVIFIPGIMGSPLYNAPNGSFDDSRLIWAPTRSRVIASLGDRYLDTLLLAEDGRQPQQLSYQIKVGPGYRGSSGLSSQFDLEPLKTYRDFFVELITGADAYLLDNGDEYHHEGEDLFCYTYDWRLRDEENALLLSRFIDSVCAFTGSSTINLVVHSNGGLVAKSCIKDHGNNRISKLIFLATPHLGAPQMNYVLLTGDLTGLMGFALNNAEIKSISRNMPSSYQLAPFREYLTSGYIGNGFSDGSELYSCTMTRDGNGFLNTTPMSYDEGMEYLDSLKGYDGVPEFNHGLMMNAGSFQHATVDVDFGRIAVFNIVGWDKWTIGNVHVIDNRASVPPWNWASYEKNLSGDGTVPLGSAETVTSSRKRADFYVRDGKHSDIPGLAGVRKLVKGLLQDPIDTASIEPSISRGCPPHYGMTGLQAFFGSPIVPHAYDGLGRHTGPLSDTTWEEMIPGSEYVPGKLTDPHSRKGLVLPMGGDYRLVAQGRDSIGTCLIKLTSLENGHLSALAQFEDVPVLPQTIVSCSLKNIDAHLNLRLDKNGDGIVDTIIVPRFVRTYTGMRANGHAQVPSTFELDQNYPNPFNPSTTIRYGLPIRAQVTLTVFNTLGQRVSILVQCEQDAGYHDVKFNVNGLPSGVYFYRLQAGSFTETKKLLIVR